MGPSSLAHVAKPAEILDFVLVFVLRYKEVYIGPQGLNRLELVGLILLLIKLVVLVREICWTCNPSLVLVLLGQS
jgi:hypothetical protein